MPTITNTVRGQFLVLPNDALGKTLIENKDFEPHFYNIAKNVVKEGDICLDCGANLGYHTVTLSKLVGATGKVFSFEPLRVIFQQLNGNVFLNDLRNVLCINAALGDENKLIQMDYIDVDDPNGINVGGTKVGSGGDITRMVRLDEFSIKNIAFMKIDVQGSEVKLFNGGMNTINESRPIIFIEVENHWLNCFNETSESLLNKILSFNYLIVRINNEYPCDHVAIPREKSHMLETIMKDVGFPYDVIDGKSVKVNFDRTENRSIIYGSYITN